MLSCLSFITFTTIQICHLLLPLIRIFLLLLLLIPIHFLLSFGQFIVSTLILLNLNSYYNPNFKVIREKVLERRLPMAILDAEYQFDHHKLVYFFEADRYLLVLYFHSQPFLLILSSLFPFIFFSTNPLPLLLFLAFSFPSRPVPPLFSLFFFFSFSLLHPTTLLSFLPKIDLSHP